MFDKQITFNYNALVIIKNVGVIAACIAAAVTVAGCASSPAEQVEADQFDELFQAAADQAGPAPSPSVDYDMYRELADVHPLDSVSSDIARSTGMTDVHYPNADAVEAFSSIGVGKIGDLCVGTLNQTETTYDDGRIQLVFMARYGEGVQIATSAITLGEVTSIVTNSAVQNYCAAGKPA